MASFARAVMSDEHVHTSQTGGAAMGVPGAPRGGGVHEKRMVHGTERQTACETGSVGANARAVMVVITAAMEFGKPGETT